MEKEEVANDPYNTIH